MVATLAAAAAFASLLAAASALDNGLALLPQMGYNSWCECHCRSPLPTPEIPWPRWSHWVLLADDLTCSAAMNETTLRKTADKMVELGLPALGYKYLVRPLPNPCRPTPPRELMGLMGVGGWC